MADKKNADRGGTGAARPAGIAARGSYRVPPVIDGTSVPVDTGAPNPPPEEQVSASADTVSFEAADAPLDHEVPHVPPPDGPVRDIPMPADPKPIDLAPVDSKPVDLAPIESTGMGGKGFGVDAKGPSMRLDEPPPPRKRGAGGFLMLAIAVFAAAGALAWYYAGQGGGDLISSVKRMVGYDATPVANSSSGANPVTGSNSLAASRPSPSAPVASVSSVPQTANAVPPSPSLASKPSNEPPSKFPSKPSGMAASVPATLPASGAGSAPSGNASSSAPSSSAPSSMAPSSVGPPLAASVAASSMASPPSSAATPGASPAATSLSGTVAPDAVASDPRVAALDKRLSDLDGRIAALSTATPKPAPETTAVLDAQSGRLGKIDATLAGLDKRLAAIETQLSAPKNDARVAQSPEFVTMRDTADAAARAVVAQGLLSAVQTGTPFTAQVAALRSLGADDATLSRLSGTASGISTLAALRDSFAALKPRLTARAPADPNATWSERMVSRVTSLVSIRPAGERTGPSPDAVASRIETALGCGDVAAALTEARTLPAADQPILKDWSDAATRRVTAEADARALLANALGALAKPKS